jgi:hypothetical protein
MASPDNPQRLLIALEPEAAAIYCKKLKFWDLKDRAPVLSTHTWHGNTTLTECVIKELEKGQIVVHHSIMMIWKLLMAQLYSCTQGCTCTCFLNGNICYSKSVSLG